MSHRLTAGEQNISELAAPFSMSFVAVSKHVRVLEAAGLVRRQVEGRCHRLRIAPAPLAAAGGWLRFCERLWTNQLDALLKAEDAAVAAKFIGKGSQHDLDLRDQRDG